MRSNTQSPKFELVSLVLVDGMEGEGGHVDVGGRCGGWVAFFEWVME